MINYQGKLTEPDGVAYHEVAFPIIFKIYDSPTSLGDELFEEEHESVLLTHGLFDVIIGSIEPLRLPFDEPYWLELTVDGEVLSPRQPFTAVPYAYRAINADTSLFAFKSRKILGGSDNYIVRWNGDDEIEPSLMYETDAGQIGVGTTTPTDGTRLEVIANGVAASRAVLARSETGDQEGWLASEFYGVYGQFDSDNYGALGSSGIGVTGRGELHAGYFEGNVTLANSESLYTDYLVAEGIDPAVKMGSDLDMKDNVIENTGSGDGGAVTIRDDIVPGIATNNIGSSLLPWNDLYLNGSVFVGAATTIDIAGDVGGPGKVLKTDGTRLYWADDSTASIDAINHNELDSLQGGVPGEYYHLTATEHTGLTGGGTTDLHNHDDRYYTQAELASADSGAAVNWGNLTDIPVGLDTISTDDITTSTVAGGDLSGFYPNPTVTGLQGEDISTIAPASGEILKFNGDEWVPGPDEVGDPSSTNEFNTAMNYNPANGILAVTDAGGTVFDTIPVWEDDLSDNSIGDLGDVNLSGLLDGHMLMWNEGLGQWVTDSLDMSTPPLSEVLLVGNLASNDIDMDGTWRVINMPEATETGQAMPYGQTAGGQLSGTYPNPNIAASVAGPGLIGADGAPLEVLTGTGIRIEGDSVRIDEENIPYRPSDTLLWTSHDPGDIDDAIDTLMARITGLAGGDYVTGIIGGEGIMPDGPSTGSVTIDIDTSWFSGDITVHTGGLVEINDGAVQASDIFFSDTGDGVHAGLIPVVGPYIYSTGPTIEDVLQDFDTLFFDFGGAIGNLRSAVGTDSDSIGIDYGSNNFVRDSSSLITAISALDNAMGTPGAMNHSLQNAYDDGNTISADYGAVEITSTDAAWPGLSVTAAAGGNAIEATGNVNIDGNLRTTQSIFMDDGVSGYAMELSLPGVTADRNITFPDASGEVLLDIGGGSLPPGTTDGSMLRWDGTSWVENTGVRTDATSNLHVDGDLTLLGGDGVFRGNVDVASLTGDRIYTFPDASGEISLLGQSITESEIAFGLGPDSVSARSIPYDDATSGLGALTIQDALDSLAAGRDGFIRNTEPDGDLATGQDADIDITGDAEIGGTLTVGDIAGQGTASSTVSSIVAINSTSPIVLTSIPSYTVGAGSVVQLTFTGLFDDRANTNNAYFRVEVVRNPGTPGEVVLYTTKRVFYSRVSYQESDVNVTVHDIPGPGTYSYGVRAIQESGPYDAGRCVSGNLNLLEIKS